MYKPMIQKPAISLRHKNAPGPHGHFLLGNARDIQRNPLGFALTMTRQYGDIVRMRLAALGTLTTGAAVAMLDRWQDFTERNQPLDVAAEMLRLTLCIVGKALFNIDLSDEAHSVSQAVTTVNRLLSEYLYAPFPPLNVPTPRNRRIQDARRALDQVVFGIITQRRQQNTDAGDLPSMLLLARDEETGLG